jgi:FkbM family methyltransferase
MSEPQHKIAFLIAATEQGTFIINRLDYNATAQAAYGVSIELLENGAFAKSDVDVLFSLIGLRRKYFGDGLEVIDCGANLGIYAVNWAQRMRGWGRVTAIEAQERIFYALAGNIAINNCFNAKALHAAVSSACGTMRIPALDYQKPASFGSLELKKLARSENIGQSVDYSDALAIEIPMISIDSMKLERCDLIKIDVEGMEIDVLEGAVETIQRHRPIIFVETIKSEKNAISSRLLSSGYRIFELGINFLAIHSSDRCLSEVKFTPTA